MGRFLAVFALFTLAASAAQARNVPGQVMVRFRPGTPALEAGRALDSAGMREADEIPGHRIKLVKFPPGLSVEAAIERLKNNPNVESAEPNMALHAAALPDDTLFPLQWGLNRIGASQAWDSSVAGADGSASTVIAVVDSGIDLDQPDFAGKLVAGSNIINPAATADDDNGHGTLVAGIAGAATNNGAGIAGVARNARLMPVKVLNYLGDGDEFTVLKGVEWAVNHGAKVINISIGSCDENGNCGTGSTAGADLMEAAWNSGVLVVAAAGNEHTSNASFPSAYPLVTSVTATDRHDEFASAYSNYGAHIDLCAPGGNGTSACDATDSILGLSRVGMGCGGYWGDCEAGDGTSLAAPFVSGVAAVLMGSLGLTNQEAYNRMISTADRPDSLRWDRYYGYGRVNLYRALTNDRTTADPGAASGYVFPNPFSPARDRFASFVVTSGSAGQSVEIKLRDIRGVLLWEKSLTADEVAAADLVYNTPLKWDGRDSKGNLAPNGIYFAVIKAGGTRKVVKVAVLH